MEENIQSENAADAATAESDDHKPGTENDTADVSDDGAPEKNPIQILEAQRDEAQKEAAASHERFLRTAAEFENYKKRIAREMDDLRKYANESLLKESLNAVDNLERAIDSAEAGENQADSIVEGVRMTLQQMLQLFEKYQVKPIDAVGQPFDPAFHQAFMTEESDEHPENTVISEFQKGYTLHDRLLRPSMVVVSKAKNNDSPEAPEKQS